MNTSDPESRILKGIHGFVQGHNAQAVVSQDQIVIAAEVVPDANDVDQLHPMLAAAADNLQAAGFTTPIGTALADAGYASEDNLNAADPNGPDLLVALGKDHATRRSARDNPAPASPPPPDLSARERMDWRLRSEDGQRLYRQRKHIVEPVFGQHKQNRGYRRFARRGQSAADSEWKLMNATHNLIKLYRRNSQQRLGPRHGGLLGTPATA
ncbi:MAG: transposase [Actinomycetota bacterium]